MIDTIVTGSSGYLGSVLDMEARFHFVGLDAEMGFDVRDEALMAKAFYGMRSVVHLAALRDADCQEDPEAARSVNVEGTRNVVEAAEKTGVERIILASSCSAYGWQEGLLHESAKLKPTSVYGQTKMEAEDIVLKSSVPVRVVLRFATLCGPSPRMRFDTLLNQFVYQGMTEGEIKVFEPYAWRPLVHIRDATRAIMRSFSLPVSDIVNVGYGNYRKLTIAEMVKDWRPSVKLTVDRSVRDRRSYTVDFKRMNDLLGCAYVAPHFAVAEMWR